MLLFALVFLLTACGGSPSNDTTRDDALALAGVLFAEEMGIAELTSGMKDFIACSFDYQVSQYGLSWTEIEDLLEETGDLDSLDDLNPEAPEEGPEECIGELSVTDFGLMMEASFATAIEDVVGSTSSTYGDDLKLDDLWDACDAGDDDACDELFWSSPVGSAYESFGLDCAGRGCGDDAPNTYGDDLKLDALWDACDAGDDDACDQLFWSSPIGSAYESFGRDCAGRGCSP